MAQPTRIMIPVTPFAVIGVAQQHPGQVRREVSQVEEAVQCSAFARIRTSGGWLTARSCAMEDGTVPDLRPRDLRPRGVRLLVAFPWLP